MLPGITLAGSSNTIARSPLHTTASERATELVSQVSRRPADTRSHSRPGALPAVTGSEPSLSFHVSTTA